jgi:hypothetical protein
VYFLSIRQIAALQFPGTRQISSAQLFNNNVEKNC